MRLSAAFVPLLAVSLTAIARAPSFVVILFDDTGYADHGLTGSELVPTPAIDSIAEDGVTFTDGYVTASVCSPSRAGMMTGRYQQRYGHEFNLTGPADANGLGLSPEAVTMAELVAPAGYRTGLIGKWHLGSAEGLRPTDQGFDVFRGLWGGSRSYFAEPEANKNHALRDGEARIEEPDELYLTTWIGEQAESFIADAGDEPYLLFVSYTAPHTPMHALDRDLDELAGVGDLSERRRTYAAMLRSLDRSVAGILEAIDATGRAGSTAVFLVNDNGGATNNGSDNGRYRGMKGSKWEGGIRVPFALRWPGVARAGSRFSHPVSTLDITATIAASSGASVPEDAPLDGTDLVPYLTGEAGGPPNETLFWRRGVAAAVREGHWKLIRSEGNPVLLFDLLGDPSERRDLSGSHPEVVAGLLERLEKWEMELAEPLWEEGERWERNQRRKHRIEVETREQERKFP